MRLRLWGTRGSLASAGSDTVRYGGNTSCVEVNASDGTLIILDAGSGIRGLGGSKICERPRSDILLTHLHMDHLLGIGFFRPLYVPECEVHIWVPPLKTLDLRARLTRYFSPPLFPTPLRELPCRLELHEVPRGCFRIGGVRVTADLIIHPGSTVGFRLEEAGSTIAYLPDHEPALGAPVFPGPPEWTSGYDLSAGADFLIHDAQYTDEVYQARVGWGHSTVSDAMRYADHVGAAALVTFHHDPAHADDTVDAMLADARARVEPHCRVIPGTEGRELDTASPAAVPADACGP